MLDMSVRNLERVLYYESHVVIDPGNTELKHKELIDDETYNDLLDRGSEFTVEFLQKLKLEIVVDDERVDTVVKAMSKGGDDIAKAVDS